MKKILILTSILSILFSCKENRSAYYPSKDYFEKNNSSLIEISNKVKSIEELENILVENSNLSKVSYLNYKGKFKIALFINSNGLIKERNIVSVAKDSIVSEEGKFHFSQINNVLEKHLLNNGRSPYYSSSPDKAVVQIIPSNDLESFYETINKLIESFENFKTTNTNKKANTLNVFYDLSKGYDNFIKPPKPKE
ncbi:hypothetical protein [Tenacibaculum sp. 190524A05c]|uniref:hypothetical protein n=1 Tax=Tenacibaculum platacis TaxID=3137852 RepID=UPI0032B1A254